MHISTNLFLPFVLIPLTLASPPTPSSFFLKTQSSDASKDNLYLSAYHITPGVNDAVLESDKTHAIVASLNDTAVVYPSGPGVAYGLNLIGEAYTQWSKVQITPGVTKGYVVLPNGTLTNTEFPGFG
ncbi:hypothetical protein MMC31_007729, partial [Peltigera leucophlebia]|nr:hypothetical protein [Peltigera leucophlebia]